MQDTQTRTIAPARRTAQRGSIRSIAVAAMLSAVAFVLMFLEFPIPLLIPEFVKMDFSDLPALLGAFALGPVYGIVISLLKNLLHMLISGSTTAGIGELCNFMLGAAFSCTAGLLYRSHKSRRRALWAALAGAVAMAVFSVPLNLFVTYPMYIRMYASFGGWEAILAMYRAILPGVNSLLECLLVFNMPFTLLKGLLDVGLCFLIYKPLSPILHGRR